jgi:hypothetical protein
LVKSKHPSWDALATSSSPELLKESVEVAVNDVELEDGTLSARSGMVASPLNSLGKQFGFIVGATDDNSSLRLPLDRVAFASEASPDSPPIREVAPHKPPQIGQAGIASDVGENLSETVVPTEVSRCDPLGLGEGSIVGPPAVVPPSPLFPGVEGMFVCGEKGSNTSSLDSPESSALAGHDRGNPSPPAEVGEHSISNSQRFDGPIAVPRKHIGSSSNAGEPAAEEIDTFKFPAELLPGLPWLLSVSAVSGT